MTSISDQIEQAHYQFMPTERLIEMRDNALRCHDQIMLAQNFTTARERKAASEWNRVRFSAIAELKRRARAV